MKFSYPPTPNHGQPNVEGTAGTLLSIVKLDEKLHQGISAWENEWTQRAVIVQYMTSPFGQLGPNTYSKRIDSNEFHHRKNYSLYNGIKIHNRQSLSLH